MSKTLKKQIHNNTKKTFQNNKNNNKNQQKHTS